MHHSLGARLIWENLPGRCPLLTFARSDVSLPAHLLAFIGCLGAVEEWRAHELRVMSPCMCLAPRSHFCLGKSDGIRASPHPCVLLTTDRVGTPQRNCNLTFSSAPGERLFIVSCISLRESFFFITYTFCLTIWLPWSDIYAQLLRHI